MRRCVLVSGLLFLVLAAAVPAVAQRADTGLVVGTVIDQQNAVPLPGVPVTVTSTQETIYTDLDGTFRLNLPAGPHELRIELGGYATQLVQVTVAEDQTSEIQVALGSVRFAETVTVQGTAVEAEASTAAAQLMMRMNAPVLQDNIGAIEMKQNADGNAASAMQRVAGLSIVDNSYVFVRGLGERYSNTTLGGAVIPTTEPDRKVVPLDLFPSSLLSSVSVAKSYSPDMAADFAGGLVEVVPLKFPNAPVLSTSWTFGYNSLTTGGDILTYAGGDRDWLGFDDGTRSLPAAVPNKKVIRGGIYTPEVGVIRSELDRIGESFSNNWNLERRSAKPNQSFGLTFGQPFGMVGVLLSYTQSYREQFRQEEQTYFATSSEGVVPFHEYDFEYGMQSANVGAVANIALQFTPNQRISWQNFYTHTGKDEARTFEGFNSDIDNEIRDQRLFFVEEALLTTGLTGEHFFGGANSRIDWRATVSTAKRDEPDLREVLYERSGGVFVLADESQSGFRMFNDLDDDTADLAANWSGFTSIGELPAQIKVGAQYVERTRVFDSRQFRFDWLDPSRVDLTASPEVLFAQPNIGTAFEIREQTRVTDHYSADQSTASGYGMLDLALTARTRVIGGARMERFDQRVDTFDLFDFEGDPAVIRARIQQTDVFPSVNFVVSPRPDHNLRLSFSQTVNRPEFRELAPFEFTDIVGGRAVVGNPSLQRALIQNYDVRYEVFPGSEEVLAASFFLKRFDQPIERIVEPTAQLRTSFTNAESARNVGVELEARKRLGEHVLVGANYTFVDSRVTLAPAAVQVQTSLERPLAGQSKNLFNLLAEVRGDRASLRVLYNFFGERISDVGSFGLPDILEDRRGSLDLVLSTRLFERLNVRLSADNLTDEDFLFTQGGQAQRVYRLGRTFAINFGFSAF